MTRVAAVFTALTVLGGCASYKATLTNDNGQTMTCEASGKSGIITGAHVRGAFDDCLAAAHAQGYK
jgi:hypothetical protein